MTSNIQTSIRLDSGQINVVGGENFGEFVANLGAVLNDDQTLASVLGDFAKSFVPGALQFAAAQNAVEQTFPGAQAQPAYNAPAPQGPPWQQAPQPPQYQQPAPQYPQAAAPARQPAAQPPGATPVCDHGVARNYKTGTKKDGSPYAMWKCTLPQGQDCKPIWL